MAKTMSLEQLASYLTEAEKKDTTKRSWDWFIERTKLLRPKAQGIIQPTPQSILKNEPNKLTKFPTKISGQGSIIGKLILFQYDPKLKDTLPYWDKYPIGFPIEIYSNGYLMLNLHYLPPKLRSKLMDNLYSFMANPDQGITDKSKLLLSYKILKQLGRNGLYVPCIKRYLFTHVKTPWQVIKPAEWDLAAFLPLQRFQKAPQTTVWQDSVAKTQKA